MRTLQEATEALESRKMAGTTCECCGQFAKVYKRTLYRNPAIFLKALYELRVRLGQDRFFHVTEIMETIPEGLRKRLLSDGSKSNYWDLVEEQGRKDGSPKRNSGFWRISDKGAAFVEGTLKIRKYALIYDAKVIAFDGEEISFNDALGEEFNYQALMSR